MRPYAEVIGDPIAHSKSPTVHRFWLDALNIDADYRAVRISRPELHSYLDGRRQDPVWRGCNVTAPLKERALDLVDELTDRARRVGAINLILPVRGCLIGDNTDLEGLTEAVPADYIADKTAILIGAGGAARAALDHLQASGASRIIILAPTPERAIAMRQAVNCDCTVLIYGLDAPRLSGAAVLINASPMGMKHAPMAARLLNHLSVMCSDGLVFDMVYDPIETPLRAAARRTGIRTSNGLTMLVGQAAAAFERLFGEAPPRDLDEELLSCLASPSAAKSLPG